MKHSDAETIVRRLLPIVQKFRSDSIEAVEKQAPKGTTKKAVDMALLDMFPWIFDDNRLMHALSILTERLDKGGQITGMEFYNLMTIFHRFEPEAMTAIELAFEIKFPEPRIEWIPGWETE